MSREGERAKHCRRNEAMAETEVTAEAEAKAEAFVGSARASLI